ncbi:cytochrome P450 6k1-like isoform X2 [Diabrotica undecimpunctata]|uniref:cytochrome P450 6k1-like isoform X2 n=1 Tax=Diabrotica undecimpunctata TaxID=50387 RepID=UPI003B63642D
MKSDTPPVCSTHVYCGTKRKRSTSGDCMVRSTPSSKRSSSSLSDISSFEINLPTKLETELTEKLKKLEYQVNVLKKKCRQKNSQRCRRTTKNRKSATKFMLQMLLTSSWFMDILLALSFACVLIYKYLTRHFNYWKKRNVQHPKPIPLFGNFYNVLAMKSVTPEYIKSIWNKIDAPYFGMFIFDEPVLVLKSPKLIKDVLTRHSSTFYDRRIAIPAHPNMAHGLFFLKDEQWKTMRNTISPLFTSGMIKQLEPHFIEINNVLSEFLTKNSGVLDTSNIAKNLVSEFLIRSFFNVKPKCFEDPPSIIQEHINKMFKFSLRNILIQNLFFFKPTWISALKLNFIPESVIMFFESIFKNSMVARESYTGKPQNLVDLANKSLRDNPNGGHTSDFEVFLSNALLFLIAGQDTTSTTVKFSLYELAMNQEIQDKLRNEVRANVQKYGSLSFEGVQDNKYLGMCINETLRKYPALPFIDRTARTDFKFEDTDLVVEKNMSVLIPTFSLQRDENFFSNPELFDPERFLDDSINSDGFSFIPFGEGPKYCIGKRLGLLIVSMILSNVILNFKLEKCSTTPEKIEFEPRSFVLSSKVGLPIMITPIKDEMVA